MDLEWILADPHQQLLLKGDPCRIQDIVFSLKSNFPLILTPVHEYQYDTLCFTVSKALKTDRRKLQLHVLRGPELKKFCHTGPVARRMVNANHWLRNLYVSMLVNTG